MSAEAYRYFTEGLRHIYLYSFDLAAQAFQQAIEADSTYTDAYIFISRVYSWQRKDSEAFKYLEKASLSNENISIFHQFAIDGLRAYLDKNQQEMIKSHEKVVKLRPRSFMYWLSSTNAPLLWLGSR